MKANLTQDLVLKSLNFDKKPVGFLNGKLVFEPNGDTPYVVFDSNRSAPIGFGVKIAKTKKSYLIQRRVGGKVIKAKVGNVGDFHNIDIAREKARSLVESAKDTGRNPNVVAREKDAAEITLGEAFDDYRSYLKGRAEPAKPNTLKTLDKAQRKLAEWGNTKIRDLASQTVLSKFNAIAAATKTTAEQTFRWANAAVKHAIAHELHDANSQGRQPLLTYSPFSILWLEDKFRSREQLEASYAAKGVRNPLSADQTLGQWLDALWGRRRANRTGCDYLLASLLWGARKSEPACLLWRDRISEEKARASSFVDLARRLVVFFDTKNGSNHELPISAMMFEVLKQRHELTADENEARRVWVFPAESKFSKVGHYSDSTSLLKYIRIDAGITKLTNHDLRRTFGSLVDGLGFPHYTTKRLLNHGSLADPTTRYAGTEWSRLCDYMQRIEEALLMKAPKVYNALRPVGTPPLPETPDEKDVA